MSRDLRLKVVRTPDEWASFHRIRRAELFTSGRYDENHPDDRARENTAYLLLVEGDAVGVARLDRQGEVGIVRLVAISKHCQGMGLGRNLADKLDDAARGAGISALRVNAASGAVGFYERLGWKRSEWDRSELTGIAADAVQMIKHL